MNNNLLQIKIKQRLNKLASFDFDNLECWQIAEAFNKAQLEWTRRMVYGINSRKEGSEQSTGLIDDIRVLLKDDLLTVVYKPLSDHVECDIPNDYLYYVRTDAWAKKDCCPERKVIVYEVEEANLGIYLSNDTKEPNFEWAETLGTLMGDKLRVYTNNKFDITKVNLVYYRKPREVQILGCSNPSTGTAYTIDQTCEFKDDVAELLLDNAAAILAGDIESMNQFQRENQNVQSNS